MNLSKSINNLGGYPKILNLMLLLFIFTALLLILVFISMYGHIINIELKDQHKNVLQAISFQNSAFKEAINKIHPHFLIESPLYRLKLVDGILYVDNIKIENQEQLEKILKQQDLLKRLKSFVY